MQADGTRGYRYLGLAQDSVMSDEEQVELLHKPVGCFFFSCLFKEDGVRRRSIQREEDQNHSQCEGMWVPSATGLRLVDWSRACPQSPVSVPHR